MTVEEWPNWLFLMVRLAVALAIWGGFFYLGRWLADGQAIGGVGFALLAVPVFGAALAKPLIEISHEGLTWLWRQPMQRWQGVYYAFNDVQVRVYVDDDELWFSAGDVLESIGMKGIPDSFLAIHPDGCKTLGATRLTVMNPAALENLLGKRNEPEAIRFLLWMRREVVKPWERKRERGLTD